MSVSPTSDDERCVDCGSLCDASLPDRLCTRCLLAFALAAEPEAPQDEAGANGNGANSAALLNRRIGRYQLLAEIDHGGVGIVYRAWQADLKREVALKMLLPARLEAKDALGRFRREAELMAGLDHPGILPVHEVGAEDGLPYFSMKLAEGGNLAERIAALHGKFRESARLVAQIAHAIGYAHRRGVLHRDLKPSNIVFDAADQPLVTDFGLARLLAQDSSLTGIDAVIGTPRYVAPEVVTAAGARLTVAADVYGLGAILYELLCGQAPFAELTPLQILQQVGTRRPRSPRQIDATIPSALEAICLRCLEKRPDDRFPSADALAAALEHWLAGAKPTLFERLRRLDSGLPSRRRRAAWAATALLVAGLATAGAWYARREPIPTPDPATATRTVKVLPDLFNATPAAREAARQLAAHLHLPLPLRVLPFDATFATATSKDFPSIDSDADAVLGAFIDVDVTQRAGADHFALVASDDLREENLYETTFALSDVDRVARELAASLVDKRRQPNAEAHLSRNAMASLLRADHWLHAPGKGSNAAAIAALKDMIAEAPGSALAHAWLAYAYVAHGGEMFWLDSAIDEAARAQRMDPALGMASKQLGAAYYAKSWFTRATAAYEQARALDSLYLENELSYLYYATGRFADSYRLSQERQRFGTEDPFPRIMAAQILFAVGETDAGEHAMQIAIDREANPALRALREAEIAFYRRDWRRCHELAGHLEPEIHDGYFSPSAMIRACAIQQGDLAAALTTMDATKRAYGSRAGSSNGNPPALIEAILLAQLHQTSTVPALLAQARQGLQAAIDSNSENPPVWLRMASAQRLGGEVDGAYVTLQRAFALGLTVNDRNRWDPEFLPFQADARFEALRAKSEAYVAAQREQVAAQLRVE